MTWITAVTMVKMRKDPHYFQGLAGPRTIAGIVVVVRFRGTDAGAVFVFLVDVTFKVTSETGA